MPFLWTQCLLFTFPYSVVGDFRVADRRLSPTVGSSALFLCERMTPSPNVQNFQGTVCGIWFQRLRNPSLFKKLSSEYICGNLNFYNYGFLNLAYERTLFLFLNWSNIMKWLRFPSICDYSALIIKCSARKCSPTVFETRWKIFWWYEMLLVTERQQRIFFCFSLCPRPTLMYPCKGKACSFLLFSEADRVSWVCHSLF